MDTEPAGLGLTATLDRITALVGSIGFSEDRGGRTKSVDSNITDFFFTIGVPGQEPLQAHCIVCF